MKQQQGAIMAHLSEQLKEISINAENALQKAERSFMAARQSMEQLREKFRNYTFADEQECIQFHKELKPELQALYFYYGELCYLEANRPAGRKRQKYFNRALEPISAFFERNKMLYRYYRSDSSEDDRLLFLPNAVPPLHYTGYETDTTDDFDLLCSKRIASFMAYEMVHRYIEQCIFELKPNASNAAHPSKEDTLEKALFTDPKVGLVEIGYGLHAIGAINNGKASLTLIMKTIQRAFHTDLGNWSAMHNQNVRLRKIKPRSAYLMAMIDATNRMMDHADEHPYGSR